MLNAIPLLLAQQPAQPVQAQPVSVTTLAPKSERKVPTLSSASVPSVAAPEAATPQPAHASANAVVVRAYPVSSPAATQISRASEPATPAAPAQPTVSERSSATVAPPKPVEHETSTPAISHTLQPLREIVLNAPTEVAPAVGKATPESKAAIASPSPGATPVPTPQATALPTPLPSPQATPESKSQPGAPASAVVPTVSEASIAKQQANLSKRLAEIVARDRAFREAQQRETIITRAYEYANQGRFEQARRLLSQSSVVSIESRNEVLSTISTMQQESASKTVARPPQTLKQRRFEQIQSRPRYVPSSQPTFVTAVPRSLTTLPQLPNVTPRPVAVRAATAPQRVNLNTPVASDPDYSTVNPNGQNLQAYRNLPNPAAEQADVLTYPLPSPVSVTSGYGWRVHPVTRVRRFHAGVDLGAAQGTPVIASRGGKVTIADRLGGYGLAIVMEHQDGTQDTLYAHLSEIFVRPGEEIRPGMVIGRVGSTGLSTGPHLHYEARVQRNATWATVDPGPQLEAARERLAQALRTQS